MSRLAVFERDGLRFGLVSADRYKDVCERLPCFTTRELALLRKQAQAMGTPLPIPLETLRAILAVKQAMPESMIDEKIRDWPPSWQWTAAPQYKPIDIDVAPEDEDGPTGVG